MTRLFRLVALIAMIFMAATAISGTATAGAMDGAKSAGTVGEQSDGYLGLVSGSADAGTKRQLSDINLRRKAKYREVAQKNGTSLRNVETVMGKRLVERTRSGNFIRLPNGQWTRQP